MTTVQYTNRKGTRLYFTLGASLTIVLIVSMFLFPGPWAWAGYVVAGSLAGGAVLMLGMGTANIYHAVRMQQIERQNARYNSFHHAQNVFYDGQIIERARDIKHPQLPAVIEGVATEQPATMPRLLDVLQSGPPWDNPLFVYGGQQSGKTTAAIAVASSLNLPTIFIGYRQLGALQYSKMTTYIFEPKCNEAIIKNGIAAALKSLQDFEPGIIFIDDLMDIAALDVDLESLIAKCSTQARSHNKRIFFTTHSEAKDGAGLKNLSAQLKTFFVNLTILQPEIDRNLQPLGHPQTAMLAKPGDWKNAHEVRLPGPVYFPPKSDTEQFVKDYFNLSQNANIEKYVGKKNDKTRAAYLARVQSMGLPPKTT